MAVFFRVIEDEGGGWDCSSGRTQFDHHDDYDNAFAHICLIAAESAPAEVIVHRRNEPPTTLATFD